MATVPRFFQAPSTHDFLFGPRGTGKSTWLRENYPEALWIDLLKPEVLRQYVARPERLREAVAGHPSREVVVIDEVQRAPVLLDVVPDLIESRAGPASSSRAPAPGSSSGRASIYWRGGLSSGPSTPSWPRSWAIAFAWTWP